MSHKYHLTMNNIAWCQYMEFNWVNTKVQKLPSNKKDILTCGHVTMKNATTAALILYSEFPDEKVTIVMEKCTVIPKVNIIA